MSIEATTTRSGAVLGAEGLVDRNVASKRRVHTLGAGDGWGQLMFVGPNTGLALPWNANLRYVATTNNGGKMWQLRRF